MYEDVLPGENDRVGPEPSRPAGLGPGAGGVPGGARAEAVRGVVVDAAFAAEELRPFLVAVVRVEVEAPVAVVEGGLGVVDHPQRLERDPPARGAPVVRARVGPGNRQPSAVLVVPEPAEVDRHLEVGHSAELLLHDDRIGPAPTAAQLLDVGEQRHGRCVLPALLRNLLRAARDVHVEGEGAVDRMRLRDAEERLW